MYCVLCTYVGRISRFSHKRIQCRKERHKYKGQFFYTYTINAIGSQKISFPLVKPYANVVKYFFRQTTSYYCQPASNNTQVCSPYIFPFFFLVFVFLLKRSEFSGPERKINIDGNRPLACLPQVPAYSWKISDSGEPWVQPLGHWTCPSLGFFRRRGANFHLASKWSRRKRSATTLVQLSFP